MNFRLLRQKIARALRQNLVPGLILQCFALSIALCYFFWPASHVVFNFFAALKTEYGWRFSFFSTGLFGGVIPFLYLVYSKQLQGAIFANLCFYVIFWAVKGVEVDFFYQFQAFLFGANNEVHTIIIKTLFDQLIYSAIWAAPMITQTYLWRDLGFSFSQWKRSQSRALWTLQIPTIIVSNWLIWFPAVIIIYTMPVNLQLPLFNLVLCFFVLLVATLSKHHQASDEKLKKEPELGNN